MNEMSVCPGCGRENRRGAQFCDQCGAPLRAGAPAKDGAASPTGRPGVNWTALIAICAVIAVVGWLLFGPKSNGAGQQVPTGMAGRGQDTMSENPHGEMMGSPHGGGMENLQQSIDDAKAALEEQPLDIESLASLYQTYGMIGRQAQVRPYLDTAIAELTARAPELGEEVEGLGTNLAFAALVGNDMDGSVAVLERLRELRPGFARAIVMLGDIHASAGHYEEAINAYSDYLAQSAPADADYWNCRVNRARAYLARYRGAEEGRGDSSDLDQAIVELQEVTLENATHFNAWYQLGLALALSGDGDQAVAALERAAATAGDETEKWTAEAEIARLRGEEIPPRPEAAPAEDGTAAEGARVNPHGGVT